MLKIQKEFNENIFSLNLLSNNIKKCSNCFFPEWLYIYNNIFLSRKNIINNTKVIIEKNWKCNLCNLHEKKYNKSILEKEKKILYNNKNKILLLFSWWKDSIWTFKKLIDLWLDFDGFLYDNWYIPSDIIINAKDLFKKFDKKLHLIKETIEIKEDVCLYCSDNLKKYSNNLIKKLNFNFIITWNNYSSILNNWYYSSYKDINNIIYMNLPFLFANNNKKLLIDLKTDGLLSYVNFDIKWNTTNCTAVEKEIMYTDNNNKSFLSELVYLGVEKRFWFYTKNEVILDILKTFPNYKKYFI